MKAYGVVELYYHAVQPEHWMEVLCPNCITLQNELAVLIGPHWLDFGDEKNLFSQPEIEF
jgi:hypothetical protein